MAKITVFISVPRVLTKIYDDAKTELNQALQDVVDEGKKNEIESEVYQKAKMRVGGCLRVITTGSAPINPAVQ